MRSAIRMQTTTNRLTLKLSALQSKKQLLGGTLEHVEIARKANRSPEAILLMLSSDADTYRTWRHLQCQPFSATVGHAPETRMDTESSRLERTVLFELIGKEQRLSLSLGENHPSVVDLRHRIA